MYVSDANSCNNYLLQANTGHIGKENINTQQRDIK